MNTSQMGKNLRGMKDAFIISTERMNNGGTRNLWPGDSTVPRNRIEFYQGKSQFELE